MSRFTIFGGHGFIGGRLALFLSERGHDVVLPERDVVTLPDANLGHVIYAIGMTSDFRSRPMETVDAHVGALLARMRGNVFDSWLYFSSTRVYAGLDIAVASEAHALSVIPDADGIYNISKLLGEAICLSHPNRAVRVARIANVYGDGAHGASFLGMVLAEARCGRDVVIGESPGSSKDYVSVADVCRLSERIALGGLDRLYNVASGVAVTHGEIATTLRAAGIVVRFADNGPTRTFPTIDVGRAIDEFGFRPERLLDRLTNLAHADKRPT